MFLKNKIFDKTQNSSSFNIKTSPKWAWPLKSVKNEARWPKILNRLLLRTYFLNIMFLKNIFFDKTQNSSSYNIKTSPKWAWPLKSVKNYARWPKILNRLLLRTYFLNIMFLKNKIFDKTQNSSSFNIKTSPKWASPLKSVKNYAGWPKILNR